MNKIKLISLISLFFSGFVQSDTITVPLSISANIVNPLSDFKVEPITGRWPVAPLEFRWNDGAKNFTNPAPIGVKMKSTNDITVALSSSSQLTDGSAMIPVKVALNSLGANGTTVPDVSATPKKLYECKSATTFEPFDIQLAADKSGMLNGAGQPITGNDAKPFPGTYSGAVQLLFESDLTSACAP